MVKGNTNVDLIRTIDDSIDVADYSEDSDEEEEFQPNKQKNKKKKDFNTDFEFVGSQSEYNKDTWNDLSKYIKRNGKSKVDEKIEKARKNIKNEKTSLGEDADSVIVSSDSEKENENENNISDSEFSLSEDELQKDDIKVKERAVGKKKRKKEGLEVHNEDFNTKEFFEDAPPFDDNASFYQMNLSRPLLKAIGIMNFIHPTPIQAATIPVALSGRDVCGCAATGTGKTAAYMLPTLERLLFKPSDGMPVTRVLVLVPTRELGVQVYEVSRKLAQFANHVDIGLAVGGLDLKAQETVLRKSPDIVIATPGRLIDHLKNTPSFSLDSVEILILDEADRMLDEYFQEQMTEIIKQCSRTHQTILFSATMTDAVNDLAAVSLNKPVKIFVDSNQDVAFNLRQEFVKIRKEREGDREPILAALVCRTFRDHTMVFVQTKKQAHRIHILLGLLGVRVGELHGDMSQPQRLDALRRFKDEELDVLVATDVAARGLDIHGVKSVINFLLPATLEHYIHRVGRTARAGRSGVSVSMAGEAERKLVKLIVKKSRNPVKSRLIPAEIVDKYRKKVSRLDEEIKNILQEEWEERVMLRAENQANRAEKILKGSPAEQKRSWFQTHKERMEEKERLLLSDPKEKNKKNHNIKKGKKRDDDDDGDVFKIDKLKSDKSKKKKKFGDDTAEERVQKEMSKVMMFQARLAKRKNRPKKLKSVVDVADNTKKSGGSNKRKATSFSKDLTDTSKKGVKRMRYDANVEKKREFLDKKKSGGQGKTNSANFEKKREFLNKKKSGGQGKRNSSNFVKKKEFLNKKKSGGQGNKTNRFKKGKRK